MNPATGRVRIARAALHSAVDDAQRAAPRECCGVLAGVPGRRKRSDSRPVRILLAISVENRAVRWDRFEADPLGLLRAELQARRRGLKVLGYYHSHPRGPLRPSPADLDGEVWTPSPSLRLIVAPDGRWRLFELVRGKVGIAWKPRLGFGFQIAGSGGAVAQDRVPPALNRPAVPPGLDSLPRCAIIL